MVIRDRCRIQASSQEESNYFQNVLFKNGYKWGTTKDNEFKKVEFIFFNNHSKEVYLTHDGEKFNNSRIYTQISRREFDLFFEMDNANKPKTDFEELW